MQFTYKAPVRYLDTSGTNLKDITSEYNGPEKFKIYVERRDNSWAGTEIDYDDEDRSNEHRFQVLLDFANENHQVLMSMLIDYHDHDEQNQADYLCSECHLTYYGPTSHNVHHTYEFKDIKITPEGVITYPWKKPHMSWDDLDLGIEGHKKMLLVQKGYESNPAKKALYDKAIEICDHIKIAHRDVDPWKVSLPHPEYNEHCMPHLQHLPHDHPAHVHDGCSSCDAEKSLIPPAPLA